MQLSEYEQQSLEKLQEAVQNGKLTNAGLLQLIAQAGSFLNLRTRSAYQKQEGIAYNTAKNHRQNVQLFGVTFIVDNS